MLVLELTKNHIDIARAESVSVLGVGEERIVGNLQFFDCGFTDVCRRISYMKSVFSLVGICDDEESLGSLDWNSNYSKSFSLKSHGGLEQKKIADIIYGTLKEPVVRLKGADTEFHVFLEEGRIIALKRICSQEGSFESRKPDSFPSPHPSSMHPRLARAMINLTGIKKGIIADPCCGAGGILIEAGLMGLSPVGMDIDPLMIERARKNTSHFNVICKLINDDCLENTERYDYIVSDLPYAKNTKSQDLAKFYSGFSAMLKRTLGKRAVIGLPHTANPKRYFKDLKICHIFEYPLHRSLIKIILVIEN